MRSEVPAEYVTSTISESDFQATVIEMAHVFGWLVHHGRPARTAQGWRTPIEGDAGFPDLVLARAGRVIFAELKTARGRLAGLQLSWLNSIQGRIGPPPDGRWEQEAYIWRPADMAEIEATLR